LSNNRISGGEAAYRFGGMY